MQWAVYQIGFQLTQRFVLLRRRGLQLAWSWRFSWNCALQGSFLFLPSSGLLQGILAGSDPCIAELLGAGKVSPGSPQFEQRIPWTMTSMVSYIILTPDYNPSAQMLQCKTNKGYGVNITAIWPYSNGLLNATHLPQMRVGIIEAGWEEVLRICCMMLGLKMNDLSMLKQFSSSSTQAERQAVCWRSGSGCCPSKSWVIRDHYAQNQKKSDRSHPLSH